VERACPAPDAMLNPSEMMNGSIGFSVVPRKRSAPLKMFMGSFLLVWGRPRASFPHPEGWGNATDFGIKNRKMVWPEVVYLGSMSVKPSW
jgi:hypothetical protein